jgi:hypothetical protein
MKQALVSFAGALLLVSSVAAQQAARPVGSALERRVQEILPTAEEERWLQIPWRTNLAEARRDAAKEGKPILFWVMNGNPLGCA